jgi:TonB family protein
MATMRQLEERYWVREAIWIAQVGRQNLHFVVKTRDKRLLSMETAWQSDQTRYTLSFKNLNKKSITRPPLAAFDFFFPSLYPAQVAIMSDPMSTPESSKPPSPIQETPPPPMESAVMGIHAYSSDAVTQQPEFPGGNDALDKWLKVHLNYPIEARENEIEGSVYVKITIEPDGSVSDAAIAHGLYPACNAEAVRVARSLPRWKPGQLNGKSVRVNSVLRVAFYFKK